jgi:Asp-tRNA(Asn)/Glu-tRNA(Gln) amidotransferase A subunit family amidase
VQYVNDLWARIEERDREIQAFVADSGHLAAAVPGKGPLSGVAVGIKDVIRVDGLPTRAGSAVPAEALAGPQAPLVDRLLDAGAIIAGKTVTAEFAVFAPGPTRNPRDTAHTPGGSSSGSAAAVAADMVPLAIGTQTIGSVIRPAAYCGVLGFKPTYGRIPTAGVIANAPSFDTIGLFASDIALARTTAKVLCDEWHEAQPAAPVLGIPVGPYLERAEPEALDAFSRHIDGLDTVEVPIMNDFADVVAQVFTINRYELARVHAELVGKYGEFYRPETMRMIRQGQEIDRNSYEDALRRREQFRTEIANAMSGIDAWVAPAATGPAPRDLSTTGNPIMSLPWNSIGLPALTLPMPGDAGRLRSASSAPHGPLPLGLQIVGPPNSDEKLLHWAEAVSNADRPRNQSAL